LQQLRWIDAHRPLLTQAVGASAASVYLSATQIDRDGERAARYLASLPRRPLIGDGAGSVVSLRLAPGGSIEAHAAPEDVVVVAWRGSGRTRVGGGDAEISAGGAVLWPRGVDHALTAGPHGLAVFAVHLPAAPPPSA
jgi:quercetin dioxygenase-like cupin family protein